MNQLKVNLDQRNTTPQTDPEKVEEAKFKLLQAPKSPEERLAAEEGSFRYFFMIIQSFSCCFISLVVEAVLIFVSVLSLNPRDDRDEWHNTVLYATAFLTQNNS